MKAAPHKTPKQKTCRNTECKAKFVPVRPLQIACGIRCALAIDAAKKDKDRKQADRKERAERKAAKEKVKTKGAHMREAQAAFNAYIRERDRDLPCVSCGRHHQGQYHAGHYRTTAAAPQHRFEELNVHKQCAPCNNHKSGDIVNYRIELVKRIGLESVEWLECFNEPRRYTVEFLQAIKAEYRAKTRELKRAHGNA